ncbi:MULTISPECIES: FAD-dependent oxidoreductase [unclassified Streptomyces]|uniref:FAD-dependent oxidoreductase n=1 Tax=unclassified Streptomyces TaxID=2593676 RepID=UPI0011C85E5A|nr:MULTISPECIES: FAD-dependent oxidoreductase [unclassified Streptomyces]WSQ75892.1 FAD-dependent oxidoreductase [Streptomyces sp. NBC_01213]TXS15456.1 FAD-dependent oxidoreductase [Streptomyces sp. wa22]WSQ83139.1 FAD-dependent oxidoreductase [Streptomyces sp. NBC_01212]WSR10831.1 FAD-dependent oxidoreductase [Streptomyces sp. NBC_01208]WSR46473.1 FAD-dependent oxidoreductase [Streptomyces sp. NBC_01201]
MRARGRLPDATRHGRDRRAEVVVPEPGRERFTGAAPSAAVIGGGVAGLAAATALAERGVRVTLYEQGESLGGRLAGWPVRLGDGSGATMSRGFHAFFRQYYNLRGLLRRADPALAMLTPLPDYPLLHRNGMADGFARVPRTPPFSALGFVALSPSFGLRDLAAMNPREALPLLDVRVPEVYERFDGVGAEEFLRRIDFPAAARHLAFEVFSRSFFADPRELSAAELLLMFHIYFLGSSEGLLFDVPREPFPQALWEPLGGYLRRLGAQVRTGTPVHRVRPAAGGDLTVETEGAADRHQAVVLALDTQGLRHVVGASEELGDVSWRADVESLRTAPPFLVSRLWLDRPVRADRAGFLGTSGFDGLDNISVLDRWEGESARWAARTGGSVVELHAYAVEGSAEPEKVQRRMLDRLHEIYPETAGAGVVDARHEWRADCPVFSVGGYHRRPAVRTPHPRVTLAGDMVRTGLPVALMERAATSGFLAANTLLADWGVRGQVLWTVPRAGRSRVLRALAGRFAGP